MSYKVVKSFTDLSTNQVYWEGDSFPAPGLKIPDEKRLAELSTDQNKRKEILIVEEKEEQDKEEHVKEVKPKTKKAAPKKQK